MNYKGSIEHNWYTDYEHMVCPVLSFDPTGIAFHYFDVNASQEVFHTLKSVVTDICFFCGSEDVCVFRFDDEVQICDHCIRKTFFTSNEWSEQDIAKKELCVLDDVERYDARFMPSVQYNALKQAQQYWYNLV